MNIHVSAQGHVGSYHAVVDGTFITAAPAIAVFNGKISKVPVIIGTVVI